MKKIQMVGNKYNYLTVVSECEERDNSGYIYYNCVCDCGTLTKVLGSNLRTGTVKSCGCFRRTHLRKDITNWVFDRLTALEPTDKRSNGNVVWKCKCSCGNITYVTCDKLISGNTKSCGCLHVELAIERIKELHKHQNGENNPNWLGGISFGKYCPKFNDQKKEEIREKYGRKCLMCGKTEEEIGQKLDAHHIDYNKEQGCENHKWKLIPLCRSCHAKTNFNRYLWEFLLKYKLAAYEAGVQ